MDIHAGVFLKKVFTALFFGALLLPSVVSAESLNCGFARNLRLGMEGEDVRALQQFLNTTPATRLGTSGPGAPGEETSYFGPKTEAAVIKFQELYKSEILLPVGLTRGSGFVGTFTRAKIALLCIKTTTAGSAEVQGGDTPDAVKLPTPATLSPTAQTAAESPLVVMYPSSYTVNPGKKVTVLGTGFQATGNVVHIGDSFVINDARPNKSGYLDVTLPLATPKGRHELWVTNTKGTSDKSWIVVADENAVKPKVTSFLPTSGLQGTKVTVYGEGFTLTDNEIFIGSTPIKGVASPDGKTLSFTVSIPDIGLGAGVDVASLDMEFPLGFYIVNANGDSDVRVFTLKI